MSSFKDAEGKKILMLNLMGRDSDFFYFELWRVQFFCVQFVTVGCAISIFSRRRRVKAEEEAVEEEEERPRLLNVFLWLRHVAKEVKRRRLLLLGRHLPCGRAEDTCGSPTNRRSPRQRERRRRRR